MNAHQWRKVIETADPGYILTHRTGRTLTVRESPLFRYEVTDHPVDEYDDGTYWAHSHILLETEDAMAALYSLFTGEGE